VTPDEWSRRLSNNDELPRSVLDRLRVAKKQLDDASGNLLILRRWIANHEFDTTPWLREHIQNASSLSRRAAEELDEGNRG